VGRCHQYRLAGLIAIAVATAGGGGARAGCDDGLDGLGAPGSQDLIRIGRDSALALSGMAGCGVALETRIGDRKLSFVTADLMSAWDMETPVDMDGQRVRFSQAGVDLWRDDSLRWTVRVSSAEALPRDSDMERLASGDETAQRLGARGMAMTSILRTRNGRAEWLSEVAGASSDGEPWGTATRQRLRAVLVQNRGMRLDGLLRHERAAPAFDSATSVLEQDRETHAGGLTARFDAWTVAVEHYRSHDNLAERSDTTRHWLGWTGTLRYRFGGAEGWQPREAALVLNQAHRTTTELAEDDESTHRRDRAELKLAWPGPVLLRLEAVNHAQLSDGVETGTAREFAIGVERGRQGRDWRWLAAGRVAHLAGDDGFDSESESRLSLRLGAETLEGPDLRIGLQAEVADIAPRDDGRYSDLTLQLRTNLRF
jgi:hypothetical protein